LTRNETVRRSSVSAGKNWTCLPPGTGGASSAVSASRTAAASASRDRCAALVGGPARRPAVDIGYAYLLLLVERPPRTLQAAQLIVAEHVVLADKCIEAMTGIPPT